jgi:hypothetical protein
MVVSLPEPLVVDETLELIPRVTSRLGRPPLALVVNRSAATIVGDDARPAWLPLLAAQLAGPSRGVIETLHEELHERRAVEAELRRRVACSTVSFAELPGRLPIEVVRSAAAVLEAA